MVPNRAPMSAVIAIAKAPQKVTRPAPTSTFAPPARAAKAPISARKTSALPATMGMMLEVGLIRTIRRGKAAPTAKVAAEASPA